MSPIQAARYIFGTSSMEPPKHFDQSPLYTWPVVGFFIIGLIMYMRREYVWFPFHPIGFVMARWMYQASVSAACATYGSPSSSRGFSNA